MTGVNSKLASVREIPFGVPFNVFVGPPFTKQDTDVYIVLPFSEKYIQHYEEYQSASVCFVFVNRDEVRLCKAETNSNGHPHTIVNDTTDNTSLDTTSNVLLQSTLNQSVPQTYASSDSRDIAHVLSKDDTQDTEMEQITATQSADSDTRYSESDHIMPDYLAETLSDPIAVPVGLVENVSQPCMGHEVDEMAPYTTTREHAIWDDTDRCTERKPRGLCEVFTDKNIRRKRQKSRFEKRMSCEEAVTVAPSKKSRARSATICPQVAVTKTTTRSTRIRSRGWRPNYRGLCVTGDAQTDIQLETTVSDGADHVCDLKVESDVALSDEKPTVPATEPILVKYKPILKKRSLQNVNSMTGKCVKAVKKQINLKRKGKKMYKLKESARYSKNKTTKHVKLPEKELQMRNKLVKQSLNASAEEVRNGNEVPGPGITNFDVRSNDSVVVLPNNRYKCKLCILFKTYFEELMEAHLKMHAMKQFRCTHCTGFMTETVDDLKYHVWQQHTKCERKMMKKKYEKKCEIINAKPHADTPVAMKLNPKSIKKIKLEKHPDKFKVEITKSLAQCDRGKPEEETSMCTYTCTVCNVYRTASKESMETHLGGHVSGEYSCRYCDFEAVGASRLNKHVSLEHQANFVCDICGEIRVSIEGFHNHLASAHNKPLFTCKYCSQNDKKITFGSKYTLRKHVISTHKEMAFSCKLCDKTFLNKVSLTSHMKNDGCKVKHGRDVTTCKICSKVFAASYMSIHIRTAHEKEKRFKCHLCNFGSYYLPCLKNHINMHLGIHSYSCKLCAFTCVKSDQLKSHMKTHTGEKPFQCDQCPYASAWNVQLKGHKKVHELPDTVTCDKCGVVVKDGKSLSIHERKSHASSC